jgi:hypothetical protein
MLGIDDLRNQYTTARQVFGRLTDLRGQITEHPLPAIGIAFAVGIYAGLRSRVSVPKAEDSQLHHKLIEALVGAVGTALIGLARDAILKNAREWVEKHPDPERVVH